MKLGLSLKRREEHGSYDMGSHLHLSFMVKCLLKMRPHSHAPIGSSLPRHCNNLERSTTKPQTALKFIGLKWCWLEGGVVDKDSLGIMFDMSMVALGFKL